MTESLNFESFNAVLYNSLDWTSDLILPILAVTVFVIIWLLSNKLEKQKQEQT